MINEGAYGYVEAHELVDSSEYSSLKELNNYLQEQVEAEFYILDSKFSTFSQRLSPIPVGPLTVVAKGLDNREVDDLEQEIINLHSGVDEDLASLYIEGGIADVKYYSLVKFR